MKHIDDTQLKFIKKYIPKWDLKEEIEMLVVLHKYHNSIDILPRHKIWVESFSNPREELKDFENELYKEALLYKNSKLINPKKGTKFYLISMTSSDYEEEDYHAIIHATPELLKTITKSLLFVKENDSVIINIPLIDAIFINLLDSGSKYYYNESRNYLDSDKITEVEPLDTDVLEPSDGVSFICVDKGKLYIKFLYDMDYGGSNTIITSNTFDIKLIS